MPLDQPDFLPSWLSADIPQLLADNAVREFLNSWGAIFQICGDLLSAVSIVFHNGPSKIGCAFVALTNRRSPKFSVDVDNCMRAAAIWTLKEPAWLVLSNQAGAVRP